MEVSKHHEAALRTYEIIQRKRAEKKRKAEGDFADHTARSMDRTYKRSYQGRKRRGQP